jgi:5-methylcytosine-specific restriction endonuclease McrA
MSERVSKRLRKLVVDRAKGCCEYCRSQEAYATEAFSIEHIMPQQHGGSTIAENLALACQGCNNHKYDNTVAKDPVTGNEAPLFHPRQDVWSEHFAWREEDTLIEGITATGRATVAALHLNRI